MKLKHYLLIKKQIEMTTKKQTKKTHGSTFKIVRTNAKGKKVTNSYKYFDMKIYFHTLEMKNKAKDLAKKEGLTFSAFIMKKLNLI